VEYNPLTAQVRSRRRTLEELRETETELRTQLAWQDAFDPAATARMEKVQESKLAYLEEQLGELDAVLPVALTRIENTRAATRPGWNPSYWFSDDRSAARIELARGLAEIEKNKADKRRCITERAHALSNRESARESMERYSRFDREVAGSTLSEVAIEIQSSDSELQKLEAREKALDAELRVPFDELLGFRDQLKQLSSELVKAERFDRELGQASTNYEKKQIHQACEALFDSGKPGKIIADRKRAIASVTRNIKKLEVRLRELGRRGARDVQALVIDGSNLCYDGEKLIGLFPLRALCNQLTDVLGGIDVRVIFDASITRRLGLPNEARLRSQLPKVNVYVAASEIDADEFILDAAQDDTTFVLSDDRFANFPEKSAVRGDRILRHMIISDRIIVPELSINTKYES
jgi:hypothetical protein